MCCGKGEACNGVRGHLSSSADPAGLRIEAARIDASAGRGDTRATETRATVAVQNQEVPWFFARTSHREGFQREDNAGTTAHVPMIRRVSFIGAMLPWEDTPATVVRDRPQADDGLGTGGLCR
jgi:hypothetical protein